jgi:hypothetical protein
MFWAGGVAGAAAVIGDAQTAYSKSAGSNSVWCNGILVVFKTTGLIYWISAYH